MKIVVYDDSLDFGGHQIMACYGIEALIAEPEIEVIFILNPRNRKLTHFIAGMNSLHTQEAPVPTRRFQGLFNRFRRQGIRALENRFRALQADRILCIQGNIEQSSQAVLAARRAGIECISYIAIPHRMADMHAKFGRLRDWTNRYLLNQPDRYVTISESMKRLLREQGVHKPISVVPNGIPTPRSTDRKPPNQNPVLGLLGRIEFNQKRQDFAVQTFCTHPEAFHDCRLLIAGSGPDQKKLTQLIADSPRSRDISFVPWLENVDCFYEKIDLLLIPSRYEGVPLVMLEALCRGIPVVGSACDGMKDLLPEAWTFEPADADSFAETFANIRKAPHIHTDPMRQKVEKEMSLDLFKAEFRQTILQNE